MKNSDLYKDDPASMSSLIDDMLQEDKSGFKAAWSRNASRNIAFVNGDQNPRKTDLPRQLTSGDLLLLQIDDDAGKMYQTNEIEPIYKTLLSYMTRQSPTIQAFSVNQDDIAAKALAKVAEEVTNAKYDLDNELQNTIDAASWLLCSGTVFRKDFWDYSLGSYTNMQNPDGSVSEQRTGSNNTAILSGMSLSMDFSTVKFGELPWIREDYMMDVDWARKAFAKYIDDPDSIKEGYSTSGVIDMYEQLKFSVPYLSGTGKFKSEGKTLISELYIRPSDRFPQGRMVIRAGNKIVYATQEGQDNPYFMPLEPECWHPYTMAIFEPYIGRLWGKDLISQLIPAQMRINEINAAILQNANTLAKPNILAPERCLKKGILNGRGSNVYTYSPGVNGGKPEAMQGIPLPAQFFEEKKMLIDEMVRIAGTNFIMQGQAPSNVSAASAIQQLLENASNQHSTAMQMFARFHEQGFTKKLRLLKKFGVYPDEKLNNYLKTIVKKSYKTEFQIFVGATDLSDDVNVKIESSSMIPKSIYKQNETYIEMIKNNVFGAVNEDSPRGQKLRDQLIEKMGLDPIDSPESTEEKKAKWENERIVTGEPVEVGEFDKDDIHMFCHIAQLQDPTFLENATDDQKMMLYQHIKEHQQKVQMAQMQAQQEQEQNMMRQMAMQQSLKSSGDVIADQNSPSQGVKTKGQ